METSSRMHSLFSSRQAYLAALVVLFAVTIFYSVYKLTESPPTWYDEGIYIQVAHSFAERGTQSIQIAPGEFRQVDFLTVGFPVVVPVAASLKLFGYTLLAARIPMVVFILLFVAASFILIYRLAGARVALLSLAILATFPVMYGNGKNVLGEIPGLLYTMLTLIALARLERESFKGPWNYVLLGAAAGLTAASKPVFLLLPAGIAIVLLLNIRNISLRWKEICIGVLSFIIPMMVWAHLQFGANANASDILRYYANPYGVEVSSTVAQNLLRFFRESTPMYAALLMGTWVVSFCIRLYQKEKISLAEQSAFVFSVLVFLAYLRTAGWYRYFFESMTMALIFSPLSFLVIAQAFGRMMHSLSRFALPASAVAVLTLSGMQMYQLNFSSWVADHNASKSVAETTSFFSHWPKDKSIMVFNSPEAVNLLGTDTYYQYMIPTETIHYGDEILPLLAEGVPDAVLVAGGNYEKNKELFAQYADAGLAGPYMLLNRK